jgi:hypothetical protein
LNEIRTFDILQLEPSSGMTDDHEEDLHDKHDRYSRPHSPHAAWPTELTEPLIMLYESETTRICMGGTRTT